MNIQDFLSDLHPFEFRLDREDKERLRRISRKAGVSMSQYVRRAINLYAEGMEILEIINTSARQNSDSQGV